MRWLAAWSRPLRRSGSVRMPHRECSNSSVVVAAAVAIPGLHMFGLDTVADDAVAKPG